MLRNRHDADKANHPSKKALADGVLPGARRSHCIAIKPAIPALYPNTATRCKGASYLMAKLGYSADNANAVIASSGACACGLVALGYLYPPPSHLLVHLTDLKADCGRLPNSPQGAARSAHAASDASRCTYAAERDDQPVGVGLAGRRCRHLAHVGG